MPYQNQDCNIATNWTFVVYAMTPNNNIGRMPDIHESVVLVTLNTPGDTPAVLLSHLMSSVF